MKRMFFLLLLLPLFGQSQTITNINGYGQRHQRLEAVMNLKVPFTATYSRYTNSSAVGDLQLFLSGDTSFLMWYDGVRFKTYTDSVYVSGDSLFVKKYGSWNSYKINASNPTLATVTTNGYFNVKDYGATGDSTTNDRAAILTAIDSAVANGGGTIFFPDGNYKVTGSDTASAGLAPYSIGLPSNVYVLGSGGAMIFTPDTSTSMFFIDSSANNVNISNIKIRGRNQARSVWSYKASNIWVQNCDVEGNQWGLFFVGSSKVTASNNIVKTYGGQGHGIEINGCNNSVVSGNKVSGDYNGNNSYTNANGGIESYHNPTDDYGTSPRPYSNIITNNIITNTSVGIIISSNDSSLIVSSNIVNFTKRNGIQITAPTINYKSVVISNNTVIDVNNDSTSGDGIKIGFLAKGIVLKNNHIENVKQSNVANNPFLTNGGRGIFSEGSNAIIQGNVIKDVWNRAIEVGGDADSCMIDGNYIVNASRHDSSAAIISDGVFTTVTNNVIIDDRSATRTTYGVRIYSNAANSLVANNKVGNIKTTPYLIESSNTTLNIATSGSVSVSSTTGILTGSGVTTGTGTSNYLAKYSGAAAIQNSTIYETAGDVGINTTTMTGTLNLAQRVNGSPTIYARRNSNSSGGSGFMLQFQDVGGTANTYTIDTKGSTIAGGTYTMTPSQGALGQYMNIGDTSSVNNNFKTYLFKNYYTTAGSGSVFMIAPKQENGGASQRTLDITPRILHTGTAGFSIFRVSPFLSTQGSGTKYLLDLGTNTGVEGGGTHTSVFNVATDGKLAINTTAATAFLDINSDVLRLRTSKTPASATDTGNAGDLCWDANYIYICIATNTWRRVAHSTW